MESAHGNRCFGKQKSYSIAICIVYWWVGISNFNKERFAYCGFSVPCLIVRGYDVSALSMSHGIAWDINVS